MHSHLEICNKLFSKTHLSMNDFHRICETRPKSCYLRVVFITVKFSEMLAPRERTSISKTSSAKTSHIPVLFHCLTEGLAGELVNWEHNLTTENKLFLLFHLFLMYSFTILYRTFWSQYHPEKHKIRANVTRFCKNDVPEPKPGTHGQGGLYL